ncbi:MAG: hypothetical protein OEZ58_20975 [Gammaproteobacteria bacterium]|nr:hypothetical protein [Gammaproteobacteria bacterium]
MDKESFILAVGNYIKISIQFLPKIGFIIFPLIIGCDRSSSNAASESMQAETQSSVSDSSKNDIGRESIVLAKTDRVTRINKDILRLFLDNGNSMEFRNVDGGVDIESNVNYSLVDVFKDRYAIISKVLHECAKTIMVDMRAGEVTDVEEINLLSPKNHTLLSYSFAGKEEYYCRENKIILVSLLSKGLAATKEPKMPKYRWGIKKAEWVDDELIKLFMEKYLDPIEGKETLFEVKFVRKYGLDWMYQAKPDKLAKTELEKYSDGSEYIDYTSAIGVEINGKSPKEIIKLSLRKKQNINHAWLKIQTVSGEILWDHKFKITNGSMEKMIKKAGATSTETWVDNYFGGRANNSFKYKISEETSAVQEIEYEESDISRVKLVFDKRSNIFKKSPN